MRIMNFTRRVLSCVLFAACVMTANAVERLMVVGDGVWGGWSISNSIVMFNTAEQPDVWKATVSLKADAGFKFLTEACWGGLEFRAGDNDVVLNSGVATALVSSDNDNGKDCKFKVSEKANYDIVCDLANNKVTVTKAAYQDHEINHTALWMIGSATPGSWSLSDGILLVQDAANPCVFSATADLVPGEMKVAVNKYGGFDQTFYLRDLSDDTKMVFGGDDNKWNIAEAGTYDVKVDVAAMTISIQKHTSSGIGVVKGTTAAPAAYYTIAGVKSNAAAKGLTIVVDNNGKARKVMK